MAKWLRERTKYIPEELLEDEYEASCCHMIFAEDLYNGIAKCTCTDLTVAYCEYARIAGLEEVGTSAALGLSWELTNFIKIDGVFYFLNIACENIGELQLLSDKELGVDLRNRPSLFGIR